MIHPGEIFLIGLAVVAGLVAIPVMLISAVRKRKDDE